METKKQTILMLALLLATLAVVVIRHRDKPIEAVVATTKPIRPSKPAATNLTERSATVGWRANKELDLLGYFVYYGFTNTVVHKVFVQAPTNVYTIKPVEPYKDYFVYVTAVNPQGESVPTKPITFNIQK